MPLAILVQFWTPFEKHPIWQSNLFPPFIYVTPAVGIWNPTIQNQWTFEILTFWRYDFKWSSFQMVGLLDFRSCWKSRLFAAQTLFFNHLISRLVLISDHRRIVCNEMLTWSVMANRSWQVLRSLQVFQVHRVEVRLEGLSRSCRRNSVRPRSPQQCPGWSPR